MAKRIRRILWQLMPVLLIVLLVATTVAYLASIPTEVRPASSLRVENFVERELWADGSDNVQGSHVRRNFYEADRDKHPDFGVVSHVIKCESLSPAQEKSSISDAIAICRRQFGAAYGSESLLAWDDFGRHKNEWLNGVRAIPFKPKWVVIILENQAKLPKPGTGNDGELSAAARSRMIEVGYVFPADKVFNGAIPPHDILAFGYRDSVPLEFDFARPAPADQKIYSIIEKFKRQEEIKND
jgi:hypothetical protein